MYRRDKGGRGGGVLVAVCNSLDSYVAPDVAVDDCELLWVRIRLRGRRTLYVCAYYRPDVADEPSMTNFAHPSRGRLDSQMRTYSSEGTSTSLVGTGTQ